MISAHHLKAWARLSDVEVAAVADPDLGRAQARADAFGIPASFRGLSDMLADQDLDAVDIASPRETHPALVREAADRGIHVLCQKPLAPTLAEAEALAAEARGRIRLMVHENWRFRPYYRQMKAWMDAGRLGPISSCTISVKSSGLLPDADGEYPTLRRQPFMAREERLLVAEALIHQIDVARWLLGPLDLLAARLLRTSSAVVGETAAALLFETRAGAPVFIDGSLTCPGFPPAPRDRVEIIGERASILMENDRLRLLGGGDEEIGYDHATAYQESFDRAIAHFVHGLRSGEPFETEADNNLQTLALVEAAYRSAAGAGHT